MQKITCKIEKKCLLGRTNLYLDQAYSQTWSKLCQTYLNKHTCHTGSVCLPVLAVLWYRGFRSFLVRLNTPTEPSQKPTATRYGCSGWISKHITPLSVGQMNSGNDGFFMEQQRTMPRVCFMKSSETNTILLDLSHEARAHSVHFN